LSEEKEKKDWVEELTRNLDFYLNTAEGRARLLEIAKKEGEKIKSEALKQYRPRRNIIWLSRYCYKCKHFQRHGSRLRCEFWDAKIVKPFYGRPLWFLSFDELGKPIIGVSDLEWDEKWMDVEEKVVEMAIDRINNGKPYKCYVPR
jgi:hypothetical protein